MDKQYYFSQGTEWSGPFSIQQISDHLAQGTITLTTDVSVNAPGKPFPLEFMKDQLPRPGLAFCKPIQIPISLKKSEQCYYETMVSLMETRSVTKGIGYGGPALRIKIAKGLYYNAASYGVSVSQSTEWKSTDIGTVYVTNQRVIFVGGKKSVSIPLVKILDIDATNLSVYIVRENAKSIAFTGANAHELSDWVARMIPE